MFEAPGRAGIVATGASRTSCASRPVPLYNRFADIAQFVDALDRCAPDGRNDHHRRRRPGRLPARDPARAPRHDGRGLRTPAAIRATRAAEAGRSINLALAARGIRALREAGVVDDTRGPARADARPHAARPRRAARFSALRPARHEVIYSVSRAALTARLTEAARALPGVVAALRDSAASATTATAGCGSGTQVSGREYVACRGANHRRRRRAARCCGRHWPRSDRFTVREDRLDHDYKELLDSAQSTASRSSRWMRCTSGRAAASC